MVLARGVGRAGSCSGLP